MARLEALKGLATVPDPSSAVLETFCAVLSDPDWVVRREAMQSLGKLGVATPNVIDSLLMLLANEEQKEQTQQAKATAQPSFEEDERNIQIQLAELKESQSLRGDVALTLAQLGHINDAVIAAFLAELANNDVSVRERIARNGWLLGNGHPATLAALESALDDESQMVRASTAVSLAILANGD